MKKFLALLLLLSPSLAHAFFPKDDATCSTCVSKAGDTMTGNLTAPIFKASLFSGLAIQTVGSFAQNVSGNSINFFPGLSVDGNFVSLSVSTSLAFGYPLVLPATQGASGQVLINDGAGNFSWGTNGGGGVPTTGGSMSGGLNVGAAVSANNLVVFNQPGLGNVALGDTGSHFAFIRAPALLGSNFYFTLPQNSGLAGNVLSTDGVGNLSWITPSSSGGTGFVSKSGDTMSGNLYAPVFNAFSTMNVPDTGAYQIDGFSFLFTDSTITSVGIGRSSNASSDAVSIGYNSSATSGESTAVGYDANASQGGAAFGAAASAANDAIALGSGSNASGPGSVASGAASLASGFYSMALGFGAQATVSSAVQIGPGTNSTSNTLQFQNWNFLNNLGAANFSSIQDQGVTSAVIITDSLGNLIASVTTPAEFAYVHGVTAPLQAQINALAGVTSANSVWSAHITSDPSTPTADSQRPAGWISSITRNGAGDYTLNYSLPYAPHCSATFEGGIFGRTLVIQVVTSSALEMDSQNGDSDDYDIICH